MNAIFTSFYFEISFRLIEMLGSEAEVIKKFFVIELSVPSLDCLVWTEENSLEWFIGIFFSILFRD